MELCQDPDFKEIIMNQYDEFRAFKKDAYKTYTALSKETIDKFVDIPLYFKKISQKNVIIGLMRSKCCSKIIKFWNLIKQWSKEI